MQNVLAGLNPPLVAESLERGGPGNGDRRRLLEGEVGRLGCERALSSGRVLGEGPVAGAEHLVARREARYVLADRLDDAGDVLAPDADPRGAEPEARTDRVREARHHEPVPDEQDRRVDAQHNVGIAGHRLIDVLKPQDVCGAVGVVNDRLHRTPPSTCAVSGLYRVSCFPARYWARERAHPSAAEGASQSLPRSADAR